ncbi:MAG: hypothetical protein BWY73_01206 [candidate division TA06 bacterium ADurb.Bin417]|uniref:Uncharacterized protein n=1 Tax=candidate division TA06 bacterium ADurb.Bin417 TaxID=1852828 RepID=A0A1V5MCN7_UNCT6|nr:MAG: hypothetical protein BWY73_01206 [candidate division TA06 bacterium ADurb.Bin417]
MKKLAVFWAAAALVALLTGGLTGQEQKSEDTTTDTGRKTLEEMTLPEIEAMAAAKTNQAAYGVLINGRYDDRATDAVATEALGWQRARIMRILKDTKPADYYRVKDNELNRLLNTGPRVTFWSGRRSNYRLSFCQFVINNATHPDLVERARIRYHQEIQWFEDGKQRYQDRRR